MCCDKCGKLMDRKTVKHQFDDTYFFCEDCAEKLVDWINTDNDWISVKDRLPEKNTWVLCYVKFVIPVFEMERGIRKYSDVKKVFFDGRFRIANKPTHWQLLPEPPKKNDYDKT